MQTVQTQIRRHNLRHLIRVYTVCLQEFYAKCGKSEHIYPKTLKVQNGFIQMIRVDKSTGLCSEVSDFFKTATVFPPHLLKEASLTS